MPEIIAGIDEAGRGAVIGPMTIAGVSISRDKLPLLAKLGVKDSKELSHPRRIKLAGKIEKLVKDIVVIKVEACRIDSYRNSGTNLNQIEANKMIEILDIIKPDEAIIDSPDVNTNKFRMVIESKLKQKCRVIAEHKADKNHKIVSAASIIAKVEREKAIEKLKKKYGDFGPGYTSNEITIRWLKEWKEKHGGYPEIVRKTWITVSNIEGQKSQSFLSGFFGLKKDECKRPGK